MTAPVLQGKNLTKRFGGLLRNDAVDLCVDQGEIHAIIGPNGAGKTTFVNMIAGDLTPDAGAIALDGRDITRMPAHKRPLAGIGRVYQITSVLNSFTALGNVAISAQARANSFRFWSRARDDASLNEQAMMALSRVGLAEQSNKIAGEMGHGEHRQLELAMALVTHPRLLMLDEPTSGMSAAESKDLIGLLKAVSGDCAILLVEHDMDVVFSLAHRVTVLANGRVVRCGSPGEARADIEVQRVYLGAGANEQALYA